MFKLINLKIIRIMSLAVFKRESVLFVMGAMYIGKLIPGELVFLHFRFVQVGCYSLYHMFRDAWIYLFSFKYPHFPFTIYSSLYKRASIALIGEEMKEIEKLRIEIREIKFCYN